jgi:cytochrome bd ubiquinol oxidase subunit II
MDLTEVPLVLMLVGLAAYGVLGGADFGAGFWSLAPGPGGHGRGVREYVHHAMGPVWEANHVWLIFVLAVCWTAYPTAFASIMSTLAVPLFVAAVGIILRGAAYALRSEYAGVREEQAVGRLFALSSILTPFALGAAIGGIASGRVPVGNAEGDLVTSWLNPTSAQVGALAVATAAYLAAVYLAADAVRMQRPEMARAFRLRALGAGIVAGGIALAGIIVVHEDARPIWDGLTSGAGLVAVLVSGAAGVVTVALVWRGRFEPARVSAAVAVAAVVAGWPLAQRPVFLPGLTIDEAAAGHSTIVAVLVSIAIGAVVLVPSLALLFGLVLRGRFDAEREFASVGERAPRVQGAGWGPLAPIAVASLTVGVVFVFILEAEWAHVIGAVCLFTFVGSGFALLAPRVLAEPSGEESAPEEGRPQR